MATHITQENHEKLVKKSDKPVIIDAYASWCGPCVQMEPTFQALEKEMGNLYNFVKLNVDDARDLAIEYGITSVPTFVFIKNGSVKAKETGYMAKADLEAKIKKHLG
ncbi:MAG: thioredoxin [Candidatus Babeliales bacterium]